MKRILIVFFMIFAANWASAANEMKIEGSCNGVYEDTKISFTYYSTFDGCQNNSEASISFTSEQASNMKGTRVISNGQDKYTFSVNEEGRLKTVWLDFPDTTGIKQGLFKYKDIAGVLKTVLLVCDTYDYEYSECIGH